MKHLIVDTGALIKGTNLDVYRAENLWTINEVLNEVRDKVSRKLVQELPTLSTLQTREPAPEDIKSVVDFAKLTGDYASLSKTDIKVLALTVCFERETHNNSISHLRKSPLLSQPSTTTTTTSNPHPTPAQPNQSPEIQTQNQEEQNSIDRKESTENDSKTSETAKEEDQKNSENVSSEEDEPNEEGVEEEEEEDDDDDGWITPDNLHLQKGKNSMSESIDQSSKSIEVACITTDFSMQNVMLQMGLNLVSLDGLRIKTAKIFILRCETCFKVVRDVTKVFCPQCGYQNLRKSTMFTSEDGQVSYYTPPRRSGIRGTQFAMPLPKGGRTKTLPIMSEDELLASRAHRYQKKKKNQDQWDEEYIFGQRAKTQEQRPVGFGHKNPNEAKHRVGKRKKNKRMQ